MPSLWVCTTRSPSSARPRSHRCSWLAALAGAAAVCASMAASAGTQLRGLVLDASEQGASLTLDLSRATRYRLFTLANPYRIVLDLRDIRLAPHAQLPHASGVVSSVRAGPRAHGGLRLVLQLAAAYPASARWRFTGSSAAAELIVSIGAHPLARSASPPEVVRAAHAPLDSDRDVIIAVDPGHGGQDPGATGPDGIEEKNVVLAIARALAGRIDAEPGMRAVLTRDRDEFLPLRERIRRARAAHADLFVSIHADSVRDRDVAGSSVYVLSERGATDEAARWLAERENAADRLGGVSLTDKDSTLASVLLDVAQSANISASMTAAQRVLAALEQVEDVRKPLVQQAAFVVLKSPDIPSMLIETAYISNRSDERRLRSRAQQQRLADAIFTGLRSYFEQHPPPGTRFAHTYGAPGSAVLAGSSLGPTAAATP
ncbi:MAG TPA: N-acetylmuramoyl-L-alanine amidase [Steroidobacteraceae bacterium]|nr:N-acetylmuramoyl-L-alanine amidase [Steroidobacteraceae bacterium]